MGGDNDRGGQRGGDNNNDEGGGGRQMGGNDKGNDKGEGNGSREGNENRDKDDEGRIQTPPPRFAQGGGDLFYFNLVSISLPPSTIGGLFLYFIHLSLISSVGDLFFCWLSFELSLK